MDENRYIRTVIFRHVPKQKDLLKVRNTWGELKPYIRSWAYPYFLSLLPVGSFAKGTNLIGNTDIDLFISLKPTMLSSLEDIYKNLAGWLRIRWSSVREQNVSIRLNYKGFNIDLIPGKRQPKSLYDHSIYCNKFDTWKKTNVYKHIKYVKDFNRMSEIRTIKIWRNLHKLEFPSFYLELSVINALRGSHRAVVPITRPRTLANNILKVFNYLYDDFLNTEIVDPSNSDNIVSNDISKKEKQAIKEKAYSALIASSWNEIIW